VIIDDRIRRQRVADGRRVHATDRSRTFPVGGSVLEDRRATFNSC